MITVYAAGIQRGAVPVGAEVLDPSLCLHAWHAEVETSIISDSDPGSYSQQLAVLMF